MSWGIMFSCGNSGYFLTILGIFLLCLWEARTSVISPVPVTAQSSIAQSQMKAWLRTLHTYFDFKLLQLSYRQYWNFIFSKEKKDTFL